MQGLLEKFSLVRAKPDLPQLKPGQTVKVYQKVKEGNKERTQVFEGLIIAMHRKQGTSATITVRKESYGVGVERIFPLSAPFIEKIELVKEAKVRRAKLFYMRKRTGKKARMKTKEQDTRNNPPRISDSPRFQVEAGRAEAEIQETNPLQKEKQKNSENMKEKSETGNPKPEIINTKAAEFQENSAEEPKAKIK